MKKNLFVNYYNADTENRQKELKRCLDINITSSCFDHVYIISDVDNTPDIPDLCTHVPFPSQPTFNDFFFYIKYYTSNNDINVIANSDIYFEPKTAHLIDHIKENEVYALTRYTDNAFFCRKDSQDAWVFKGCPDINASFPLGFPGSDNSIAHILSKSGYNVTNPSLDIKTYHLHATRTINRKKPVPAPYLTVPVQANRIYATSINPFARQEEQKAAVDTWKGGHVLSFNTREEIDILSKEYPNVTFIETNDTIQGKYIKLDAIISGFNNINANRYIIINSDIAIGDMDILNQALETDDMLLGVRHDDGETEFPHGYDVFAMTNKHLSAIRKSEYAIGLPWWDFYVPLSIIKAGHTINVIKDNPVFTHQWHETRYDYNSWIKYGEYSRRNNVFPNFVGNIPQFCTSIKNYIESKLNTIG